MSAFAFEQKLQAVSAEGPERVIVGAVVVANDVSGRYSSQLCSICRQAVC